MEKTKIEWVVQVKSGDVWLWIRAFEFEWEALNVMRNMPTIFKQDYQVIKRTTVTTEEVIK